MAAQVFAGLSLICLFLNIYLVINYATLTKDETSSDRVRQSEEDSGKDMWNPSQFCCETYSQLAVQLGKCIMEKNELIFETKDELNNCKAELLNYKTVQKTYDDISAGAASLVENYHKVSNMYIVICNSNSQAVR